jgi:hypothetical protein
VFSIKTYVFITSDNIQPVALPTAADASNTFVGVTALVSGFGGAEESKCVDRLNLQSAHKELLIHCWCHMNLI